MANDSSKAGYLRPGTSPPYGAALEDLFHDAIAGITGLAGELVRPKYQPDPPNQPAFDVDWCAFSVYVEPVVWNAHKRFLDDGTYAVEGTEALVVTASFYGPNYQATELLWRNGIQVDQNRDALLAQKIRFIEFAEPAVVPVLLKQQWVKKADVKGTFHRWASRTYPVLTLQSAAGSAVSDGGASSSFNVSP